MFINISGKTYFLSNQTTLAQEVQSLLQSLSLPLQLFSFQANGKVLSSFQGLEPMTCIKAHIPLLGGKGGYGAKLKTQGGKKVRPNDNMFSRDMSGQRLVYTTMERQYKEFIQKKTAEDNRVAREREQFKIMQSTLKEGQSFMKLDKAYKKEVEEAEKNINNSILIGKQKLMEKMKAESEKKALETKQEITEKDISQSEEEKKQQQSPKRCNPYLNQQGLQAPLQKKVKVDIEIVKPAQLPKPVFTSAQQRFKALFKK